MKWLVTRFHDKNITFLPLYLIIPLTLSLKFKFILSLL